MPARRPPAPLSEGRILAAWEAGAGLPPALRPLPLLAVSEPSADPDALALLPLGERDARLLALREALFGPRLEAVVACPACGERLEVSVRAAELRPRGEAAPRPPPAEVTVEHEGYALRLRPPTSRDLACASAAPTPEAARDLLFARCLVHAEREGAPADAATLPAAALPDAVQAAAAAALAAADPQAAARLEVACGLCDHAWTAPVDVGAFVWHDLDRWARRLLADVHALARAYGWTERDVLALGPHRRRHYIQLAYG